MTRENTFKKDTIGKIEFLKEILPLGQYEIVEKLEGDIIIFKIKEKND